MKKLVRTSLNNVANKRGVRDLNIQLYSHDKNNAGFEFVIKNEVDLSEYKAKVLFDFQESFATWETKGTIEGNVVKVKFDTTFITKCEEVIGYLFLDSETDTLDVFKFKFNVVLSEIDKYDTAKRGFRYIKDQEVVDVITRSELEEELKKLQVNGGTDLSNYLTTRVAEETYAKKTDLPAPYNDSALVERVTNLENKKPVDLSNYALKSEIPQPYNDSELVQKIGQLEARVDMDTIYDDTPLKQRVEVLETKVDKDTIYNDEEVKRRLTELENKPAIDTSHFITDETLDSKNYLTTTVAEETYAKKSEIPQAYNDSALVERVTALESKAIEGGAYDDTDLRNRVINLENKPALDTSEFVTNQALESRGYIKDINNLVTKDELQGKHYISDISNLVTKEELENKGYLKTHQSLDNVVTKEELESKNYLTTPYNDTPLKERVEALESKTDKDTIYDDTDLSNRVRALEDAPKVDVNNFATKDDVVAFNRELNNKVSSVDFEDFKKTIPAPYNDKTLSDRVLALENKPTIGGTQIQDTGWLKVSGENAIAGNIVEIRRIGNTVHVRFRNENDYFIVDENLYFTLDKEISGGFGSVTNNSPIFSAKNNRELGRFITNVFNNRITVESMIDVELSGFESIYINEFSYVTDDPFPTNLH